MNGHDLELDLEGCLSWQKKANFLADMFCQDENDRELVKADTYDFHAGCDDSYVTNEGEYGDYVGVEIYRKLAERFLMAMELIKIMESNDE